MLKSKCKSNQLTQCWTELLVKTITSNLSLINEKQIILHFFIFREKILNLPQNENWFSGFRKHVSSSLAAAKVQKSMNLWVHILSFDSLIISIIGAVNNWKELRLKGKNKNSTQRTPFVYTLPSKSVGKAIEVSYYASFCQSFFLLVEQDSKPLLFAYGSV